MAYAWQRGQTRGQNNAAKITEVELNATVGTVIVFAEELA